MSFRKFLLFVCTVLALCAVADRATLAAVVTNAADAQRTGWYPDQQSLTPTLVSSANFTRRFDVTLNGQIYAQPLVAKNILFIVTQSNYVYGIDYETGRVMWTRQLGPAWNTGALGCTDLQPTTGVTGTPVIDESTDTAYFTNKTYVTGSTGPAAWYMHAVDIHTGSERANFPVRLQGIATNAPSVTFNADQHLQRPGLLLMDGVVYAAFGSHCDAAPWQGWVIGVNTAGQIKGLWVSRVGGNGLGAAIWGSGGGLVSDGSGRIFLSTGNDGIPTTPTPGSTPPASLGESVVRLQVAGNGTFTAADFFTPKNAVSLDAGDIDLASGSPVSLPSAYFGNALAPHLLMMVGKDGIVYLLNRDNLGGYKQGASQGDLVVNTCGEYGGVWGRPAVWPGDGGYVYIPTVSNGTGGDGGTGFLEVFQQGVDGLGKPIFNKVARSTDAFGYGASPPVVSSNGTTTGSALVWLIWSADLTGANAQLRAYDPLPVSGAPALRWSYVIGTRTKFNSPGLANGMVFIANRDGHVMGFGPPALQLTLTKLPASNSVHLQWTGGNAPYTVTRALNAGFSSSPTTLQDHQAATSLNDAVLNDGRNYFYLVK